MLLQSRTPVSCRGAHDLPVSVQGVHLCPQLGQHKLQLVCTQHQGWRHTHMHTTKVGTHQHSWSGIG